MNDIDAMLVCVLVERGMATWLYGKVTDMEIWRVFVRSYQYLACSAVCTAIFRSVGTDWHTFPTQLVIFHVAEMMNDTHSGSP